MVDVNLNISVVTLNVSEQDTQLQGKKLYYIK